MCVLCIKDQLSIFGFFCMVGFFLGFLCYQYQCLVFQLQTDMFFLSYVLSPFVLIIIDTIFVMYIGCII